MAGGAFTSDQRALIDATVLEVLAAEPLTSYAVSCRVERKLSGQFAVDWRDLDASLQRLRKRGAIKTVRSGSFSHWHREDTE
jgi:DNA-binding PadR family transcriptional regulator